MKAYQVYKGSNGEETKAFYAELEQRGPMGVVALNLFRAQKCSTRAKRYTRRYKESAYGRKQWSLDQLTAVLKEHGESLNMGFGWGRDETQTFNKWVLYVDLPQGQVSFHSPARGEGPDYPREWDGKRASEERILAFCQTVYESTTGVTASEHNTNNLALAS